jgi:hypothetical protein
VKNKIAIKTLSNKLCAARSTGLYVSKSMPKLHQQHQPCQDEYTSTECEAATGVGLTLAHRRLAQPSSVFTTSKRVAVVP